MGRVIPGETRADGGFGGSNGEKNGYFVARWWIKVAQLRGKHWKTRGPLGLFRGERDKIESERATQFVSGRDSSLSFAGRGTRLVRLQ